MPPADRTHPVILDHFEGLLAALDTAGFTFPVGEWRRPEALDSRFDEPPFALLRMFPSAAEFDGPLLDTQVDINLRFQIVGVGQTQSQAINITDNCRGRMQPSIVSINNRYIQSIRLMVVSAGVSRDDDILIPFFESSDLYELRTTPS